MTSPNILCPVDFSPASLSAAELAAEEARLRNATLELHHVWQPGMEYAGEGPPIPFASEVPTDQITADLASINVELPADRVRYHVTSGDPARDIVELAERLGSTLVVMGSHARHGLGRWIVGSVCENVLRHCHTPVLICRGPEAGET